MGYNCTLPINKIINQNLDDCNGDAGRAMFALAWEVKEARDEAKNAERIHDSRMSDMCFLVNVIRKLDDNVDPGWCALRLLDVVKKMSSEVQGDDSDIPDILDKVSESLIDSIQEAEREEMKYHHCRC